MRAGRDVAALSVRRAGSVRVKVDKEDLPVHKQPVAVEASARPAGSRGAATLTEGLDDLDRDRASSLADEGGAAAAAVEAQPPPSDQRSSARKLWLAAPWGLAALVALYLRRSR